MTTWRCRSALAEVHSARADGNRALDSGDHDTALAHASAIRAMMGILGCDPLDERWESRDETSAALAAVDVLVHVGAGAAARTPARSVTGRVQIEIRDRLKEAGIEVTDTADGPQWSCSTRDGSEQVDGRQLTTPRRGAQGRHQEGPEGRIGRSPPARPGGPRCHAARPHAAQPSRRQAGQARRRGNSRAGQKKTDDTEIVLGRNPVLECLRAGVPATALYVALGTEADERLTESVTRAADSGIPILEVPAHDLDRMSTNGLHQGIALQVPPYDYAHPDDMLRAATTDIAPALLVALDNISDPRNLGAIVRSVAAFGGNGVLIPQRRSASVTAVAWRTSAGAAARLPVARATNLNRTLKELGRRRPAGGGTGRRRRHRARRTGCLRADRWWSSVGGQGAVAAGPGELRCHGVDPDGRARPNR